MYIVLGNETAEVDLAEFEKVGGFHAGVVAVPLVDVHLGLKGMRTSVDDKVCQNSMILSYEAPEDDQQVELELTEDPLTPGIIYRRSGHDYAELQYKVQLGALAVYVYFLIDVGYCTFACKDSNGIRHIDYADLWKIGLVSDFSSR